MLATHMHVYLPFKLIVQIPLRRGVLDTTLCDKVCHWLAAGLWFSQSTPVSSTNKTEHHDIAEILLKVALVNKHIWIFLDPDTGAHTQNIESYWAKTKYKFKVMKGVSADALPPYLDERMCNHIPVQLKKKRLFY